MRRPFEMVNLTFGGPILRCAQDDRGPPALGTLQGVTPSEGEGSSNETSTLR